MLPKSSLPWRENTAYELAADLIEAKYQEIQNDPEVKGVVKKALTKADSPFKPVLDEDTGEDLGLVSANFKSKAKWEDKKTGELKERKVNMFDAAGNPCKAKIWAGSTLKVSFQMVPYYSPKDKEVGVSFRLGAVQVIELVSGGGGNAASYGFGKEEGYEGTNELSEDEAEAFREKARAVREAREDLAEASEDPDFC